MTTIESKKLKGVLVVLMPMFLIAGLIVVLEGINYKIISTKTFTPNNCLEEKEFKVGWFGLSCKLVSTKMDCSGVGTAGGMVSEDKQ